MQIGDVDVVEMIGIGEQHQLWSDLAVLYTDDAYAEMLVPAPIRG